MVLTSLAGLPAFLAYFCLAVVLTAAYVFAYSRATPHDEFDLIRANVPGAAVALGLSLIGFALPVASAIAHSANIIDCAVWGVIALLVQIVVYFLARIPDPDLAQRIAAGEMASAIWLGLASIAAGILSAASMTY
jgi:putative membrane protein